MKLVKSIFQFWLKRGPNYPLNARTPFSQSLCLCPFFVYANSEGSGGTAHLQIHGPRRDKTCLRGFANNKGPDQPAHPHSLISAFVIRTTDSWKLNLKSRGLRVFEI